MFDRFLGKTVPVWCVAAIVLFFALGTVAFGWYLLRSIERTDDSMMARAVIEVASFPRTTKHVFQEIGRRVRGNADYTQVTAHPTERRWSEFSPVASKLEGGIRGLIVRHGPGTAARGWRIIVGTFPVGTTIQHTAVLLSPDLEMVHSWPLIEDGPINATPQPPSRIFPHGFSLLRDGSVIYTFDHSVSLHRKNWCGLTMWATPGQFSHTVTLNDAETTVWTVRTVPGNQRNDAAERTLLVQVAVDDGRIVSEISMADIIAANPEIDILELRRRHADFPTRNSKGRPGRWLGDPFHLNDVDPLPRSLAHSFPTFSAGDLLVSVREINLIFVLDPKTLAVKWWFIGAAIRQHDPDWLANGRLGVFNNRMARDYSEIVEIDPATFAKTVAVDGRRLDFYSRIRGKQQALPGGGWLITSAQQGRVMELSPSGDVALEFYIVLRQEGPAFGLVSEALFLPEEAIDLGAFQCPKS
jgi:hypothetical protein